jgi:hypothetical protein
LSRHAACAIEADMKPGMRLAVVAIAICSWLAISNHCAVAVVATKTDTASTECPFHSKPAKQEPPSSGVQCCKILRAVASVATKSWTRDDAKFSEADHHYDERMLFTAYSQTPLAPLFLDTGPPNAHSFAELILQRSLLVHAPPSLA